VAYIFCVFVQAYITSVIYFRNCADAVVNTGRQKVLAYGSKNCPKWAVAWITRLGSDEDYVLQADKN